MKTKEKAAQYPILSVRITPSQWKYIRRYADERKLSIANYVRAVLFPFGVPDDENNC